MEKAISYIVNNAIKEIGSIIGTPLAVRLACEEFERLRSIHKEMSVRMTKSGPAVRIRPNASRKVSASILEGVVCSLMSAYSSVIGTVAETIITGVVERAAFNYGDRHPEISRILDNMGKS